MIAFFPFIFFTVGMLFSMIMVLRTGKGLPQISHPYCSNCNYDLRVNWNTVSQCPECGNDLKQSDAVYFGRSAAKVQERTFEKRMPIFALILILFAIGANLFVVFIMGKTRPAPPVAPVKPIVVPAIPNTTSPLQSTNPQTPNETP